MKQLGILFLLLAVSAVSGQYVVGDWDERNNWMDVPRILERAGVRSGDAVADIGCHEGFLSMHLSRRVGEHGKVFAVDVREDRLSDLKVHARERGLWNITTVLAETDDPKLPRNSLDVVFIMDTYHEMQPYEVILKHVKNALKPGGRIAILEKMKAHARGKSREEQVAAHTLSADFVKNELQDAGFMITHTYDDLGFWENEPDKQMWMLLARVPEQ